MGLFDFLKKQNKGAGEPAKEDELEIYSGMRVEVTTHDGRLLFVAKLIGPHHGRAELHQYSEADDIPETEEPLAVRIRGYHVKTFKTSGWAFSSSSNMKTVKGSRRTASKMGWSS